MYNVYNSESLSSRQLPLKSSLVNFSIFKELESPIHFRSFSIKYVCEGKENYTVNNHLYGVTAKQYILANNYSTGKVEIDSKLPVKGICIDVAPEILDNVLADFVDPNHKPAEETLHHFFNSQDFLENKYNANETHLGKYLLGIDHAITSNPFDDHNFSKDFYFKLAESIVLDHHALIKKLFAIRSIKTETRKDLFRKAELAKKIIENEYKNNLSIEALTKEIAMSEYHFYRVFKSIYKISPHQYLINIRLKNAYKLLERQFADVTTIALMCGFNDLFTFSKAFKKVYQIPPSKVLKK